MQFLFLDGRDFNEKQQEQEKFFTINSLAPNFSGIAFDLGCGHGLQSVSLVSWYPKLLVPVSLILSLFEKNNLTLIKQEIISGMTYLIAGK